MSEITRDTLLDQLHLQERDRARAVIARYVCRDLVANSGELYQGGFDDTPEGKNVL